MAETGHSPPKPADPHPRKPQIVFSYIASHTGPRETRMESDRNGPDCQLQLFAARKGTGQVHEGELPGEMGAGTEASASRWVLYFCRCSILGGVKCRIRFSGGWFWAAQSLVWT